MSEKKHIDPMQSAPRCNARSKRTDLQSALREGLAVI